ncbi:DUF899 family protein [Paenisporosarcina cavernae]|nr:DUF899 family protein [Paenisporosarcina cavernae]
MLKRSKEMEELEKEIAEKKKQLKELKKEEPYIPVQNYVFEGLNDKKIRLSDLFGESNELIVIHNMGKQCAYCTMWTDGFSGVYPYLTKKASFVVSSPDHSEVQREFALSRNWPFRMVSTTNSTFREDLGFKNDTQSIPGCSTFFKNEENEIFLVANEIFEPGEDYSSPWHFFDLLPSGSDSFNPKSVI